MGRMPECREAMDGQERPAYAQDERNPNVQIGPENTTLNAWSSAREFPQHISH